MTPQQLAALNAIDEGLRVLRASLADPVPAPPPPIEPPAPLPPNVQVAPGNYHPSRQYNWASDSIDVSRLPAPLPWSVFVDANQTVARSMQGVEANTFEALPVFGPMNGLYFGTPALVDGVLLRLDTQFGTDPMLNIIPRLRQYPLRPGPRGHATMNPYTTWHGHTRVVEDGTIATSQHVPWWVGVVMDGTMTYAFRDGSVTYPFKLPITTYCNDFTYYEPRAEKLFFAVDTGVGKVLKVDRHTSPPTVTEFASGFGLATSIRAIGHMLYIADNQAGAVWELDAKTKARRKVCDLPHAFWIDSTSTGKLVVATLGYAAYVVDPLTGSVSAAVKAGEAARTRTWVNVSVDRNGTFGMVDAFTCIASTGGRNIDFWRGDLTGRRLAFDHTVSAAKASAGDILYVSDKTGHYPWIAEHHPDEGVMLVQGFANMQPSVIAARHPAETRHMPTRPNVPMLQHGEQMLFYGGLRLDGTRPPSFTCLMTPQGWSLLGCTADYIAEMSYADAAAFVRRGMIGSVPRKFPAEDLRALLYYLCWSSQRHMREGPAFINGLLAANLN